MSRGRLLLIGLVFAVLSATAIGYTAWQQAQKAKREEDYHLALMSYSRILKLGMTRREVEDYFNSKGTKFRREDRIYGRSAVSEIVKIGTDPSPWYCSEYNVYIVFQFAAVEPHNAPESINSDVLERITIDKWLEGCL